MLAGLGVYLLNFLHGKNNNHKLAQAWLNSHRTILEEQFSIVGKSLSLIHFWIKCYKILYLLWRDCRGHDRGSWIYFYLCSQCPSPLKLWIWTRFMVRCTQYNIIMWLTLSLVCGFLRILGIPPPWYYWNIVESGVKHRNPNHCICFGNVTLLLGYPHHLLPFFLFFSYKLIFLNIETSLNKTVYA